MKYCQSCGSQVPEGTTFCPNCGAKMEAGATQNQQAQQPQQPQQPNPQYAGGRPQIQPKNIVTAVILSIVTCGIYGIIWFINLVDDVNRVCNDEDSNQSGGMVFLLTLVTCGIYGIIWFYKAGKRMFNAGNKYGMQFADNSVLYLVLELFGLGIVNYCLIQSDLNKFSGQ